MESKVNINKISNGNNNTFKYNTIIFIISLLFSIILIFKFLNIPNNENDILKTRTKNRYPTLQRRNAIKEEDIEKILKKLESVSKNLKKNLK